MKNIWIINHYAIPPAYGGLVRHYYFSKFLNMDGYKVRIFSASKIHNTNINKIKDASLYKQEVIDGVEYTFVRTKDYSGNGFSRIYNMLEFPKNVKKACLEFNKKEKPDVIYTSSPSLFTAFQAVRIAKKLKVPIIVEIRDLWPESIVEYSNMSRSNPIIMVLYKLEKWIYKKADKLIFTISNADEYLKDRKIDRVIDLNNVSIIGNGVDLTEFEENKNKYTLEDKDLLNKDKFNIVYAGSVRRVNNLSLVVESAKILDKKDNNIQFIIYGDGNEREELEEECKKNNLTNIIFKGRVEKKYVPFIVSNANANLLHWENTGLLKYGVSSNKLMDYFAAGKPVISTTSWDNNFIERNNIGVFSGEQSAVALAKACLRIKEKSKEELEEISRNINKIAEEYDYKKLSEKLENVIESI